jgi:hypothetical protein
MDYDVKLAFANVCIVTTITRSVKEELIICALLSKCIRLWVFARGIHLVTYNTNKRLNYFL